MMTTKPYGDDYTALLDFSDEEGHSTMLFADEKAMALFKKVAPKENQSDCEEEES